MGEKMIHEQLKDYYGRILNGINDLQTNACSCDAESMPLDIKQDLRDVESEIIEKFYGCGSPIPPLLNGVCVLDLGCGTGRDVYIASKRAGENGRVIGVDMTNAQLAVARKHVDTQMKRYNYKRVNVDFKMGYMEDLNTLGIKDNSIDVVISNCVINLSPDKHSVFREIFRVLKPGGELYFSDVFADRRVPDNLKNDPVLLGECLAGAMYIEDFRRMLQTAGCLDYRIMTTSKIDLNNPEKEKMIGMVNFSSMTIRAFKLDDLEDICEDYGQVAVYKGSIEGHPHFFDLDDHHRFFTGKPLLVCGNTASMIQNTRFSKHFSVFGDKSVHFGPFDCTPASAKSNDSDIENCSAGACC
jgi:ubiquinone/menaquinone biosynthesis C-methylase UbiE